ncbi:hypothetical protein H5P28_17165 [Ruficoccus amylovorans]|uniref:Heparinase II/III-like protein n=1 Tax=Ruficoccus amylovorans TaxID=1804625 RepID=A0A842HI31_9BACT|nr:hypothetical protein [Ruficoccus amylovorans]MBC2595999.1 hypothetical protein [Ruficoccus amylovorans]
MKSLLSLLSACLVFLAVAGELHAQTQGPLFFNPGHVRETLTKPEVKPYWDQVLQTAERINTPGDSLYLDPEKMGVVPLDHKGFQLAGRANLPQLWNLGLAWQMTRDRRFGEQGAEVIVAFAKAFPYGTPASQGLSGKRGDIIFFLALGLEFFGDSMTSEQFETVAQTTAEYCDEMVAEAVGDKGPDYSFSDPNLNLHINPDLVFRNSPAWRNVALFVPWHNFSGVTMGPVGLASLTLRERFPERSQNWQKQARWVLEQWLSNGIGPDGAYKEAQAYFFYGFDRSVPFLRAIDTLGLEQIDFGNLPEFPTFWADMLVPGEPYVEDRNDDNFGRSDVNMLALSSIIDSPLAKWLYENTSEKNNLPQIVIYGADYSPEPQSPQEAGVPESILFSDRGLTVSRSGWDILDSMFSLEAGPYFHVTHSQSDKGHYNFYSLGRRWAVDSSYGRQTTVDHNLILIDGQGQAPGHNTDGTSARIVRFEARPEYTWVVADMLDAYTQTLSGQPGPSPEVALRYGVYVRENKDRPAYVVMFDQIRQDNDQHKYTYLLHTDGRFQPEVTDFGALLNPRDPSNAYVMTKRGMAGSATADIHVPEAGDYDLYAMCVCLDGANSFKMSVNGGKVFDWHFRAMPVVRWEQVKNPDSTTGSFSLDAGSNAVKVGGREPGTRLYALALIKAGEDIAQLSPANGGQSFAPSFRLVPPMELYAPTTRVATSVKSAGKATASVEVPQAGDYALFLKVKIGDPLRGGDTNSFVVSVNGSPATDWNFAGRAFPTWQRVPGVFSLNEGTNNIQIGGREPGSELYATALLPVAEVDAASENGFGAGAGALIVDAAAMTLEAPMTATTQGAMLPEVNARFFIEADGQRADTQLSRHYENMMLSFDFWAKDPRFVTGILPSLKDGPQGTMSVTTEGDRKRVEITYGAVKDVITWRVGDLDGIEVALDNK